MKAVQNFDDIPITVRTENVDSFFEASELETIPEIKPNLNLTTEPEKSDVDIKSDLLEDIPITKNFDDIPIKPNENLPENITINEKEQIDCTMDDSLVKPNENLSETNEINCTTNFNDIPIKPSKNLTETEEIDRTTNFVDIPIKPNENLSVIKQNEQINCTINFDDPSIEPNEKLPETEEIDRTSFVDTPNENLTVIKENEPVNCTMNFDEIPIKPNKSPPEDISINGKEQNDCVVNFDDIPIKTNENSPEDIRLNEKIDGKVCFDDIPEKPSPNSIENIPKNEKQIYSTTSFDDIPIKPNLPEITPMAVGNDINLQELRTGSRERTEESVSNSDNVPASASNLNATLNLDDIPTKAKNFAAELMHDDHILAKINSEKDQIEKFINISYSAKSNLDETNELDVIDSRAEINQIRSELQCSDDSGSIRNESSCEEKSLNKTKINDFTDSQIERLKLKTVIDDLKEEIELYQKKIKLLQADLLKSKERESELEKSLEERKLISKSENAEEEIVSLRSTISEREKEHFELKLNVAQLTKMYQAVQESMRKSLEVNEQIKKDRDLAQMHLTNVEAAFSDVHQKYEGCKVQIQQLRMSDDRLRRDIAANVDTIEMQSKKYDSLKTFAMGQIEK